MNRRTRLVPDLRPLTPELPAIAHSETLTRKLMQVNNDNIVRLESLLAKAKAENNILKGKIVAERRKHVRLESAVSRYLSILEANIASGQDSLRKAREAYFQAVRLPISEGKR